MSTGLDPDQSLRDQAKNYIGPDLGLNYLQSYQQTKIASTRSESVKIYLTDQINHKVRINLVWH